jgi:AraC-like DNA-binding protein
MHETSPGGLQVSRFSTASYRPHERVAAWREVYGRALLHIDIAPHTTERFRANAVISLAPGFGLLHASTSATNQANSRRLIAGDDVSFGVVTSCRWGASQLGRSEEFYPGDGALMSNGDVGLITLPKDCRYMVFCVPRSAIAPLVPDLGAVFGRRVPGSNPALQMLLRYLELARSHHAVATPDLTRVFTTHVCDLLALTIGATRDAAQLAGTRGVCAARLHALQEDIRQNLKRPDLSVHLIAAWHGVSTRYVQKLFEESGCTFTQFVLQERLDAAYKALAAPSNLPISTVAYELGFGDLSYFNRTFRRRFGCAPRDVKEATVPQ